ncbi:CBU_0592 family membrane protein [Buchananella hordeovulneris]|uniref:CBU_0592 family membrane protein n=1 Tax=Buchananella hordeovulneris TaxID=52770 RepID=UPI0026DAD941|nr:hypothetical protein [Buchananella hordeovulneris]MDO5080721.1 hypothetical protein [Buchananella hordeovulneris]
MSGIFTVIISWLGWVGAALTMGAYFLVSSKRIAPDSLRYHALNISGALMLAAACTISGAWPSFVANTVFMLIGIHLVLTTKRAYISGRLGQRCPRLHSHLARGLRLARLGRASRAA